MTYWQDAKKVKGWEKEYQKKRMIERVREILNSAKGKDTEDDGFILEKIIITNNMKNILELGSDYGYITRWMVVGAMMTGGKVISVDIIDRNLKSYFKYYELLDHWKFIKGDDRTLKWTQKMDMIFIDTSHTYKHTKLELEKYSEFAKVMFLHDYLFEKGVRDAVNEFAHKNGWTLFVYNTPRGLARLTK